MRLQVLTNVHAPGNLRVLGPLANMPEFYLAFNVSEMDAMFQPEAQRAKIW
jgi:putative endopeptidase